MCQIREEHGREPPPKAPSTGAETHRMDTGRRGEGIKKPGCHCVFLASPAGSR